MARNNASILKPFTQVKQRLIWQVQLFACFLVCLLTISCSTTTNPDRPATQADTAVATPEANRGLPKNPPLAESVSPANKSDVEPVKQPKKATVLSKEAEYLYGIVVDKQVGELHRTKQLKDASAGLKNTLFIKLGADDSFDSLTYGNHEFIKVYSEGVYPNFDPNGASTSDSIFMDDTFNDVITGNESIKERIMFSTSFDEKKFIAIADVATAWIEENIKLSVKIDTQIETNDEYSNIRLLVEHKPNLQIKQVLFYINQSALYANLMSEELQGRISTQSSYQLGIPFGINKIAVKVLADNGEEAEDEALINNQYKAKPTLHLVAIGINDYPNLSANNTLVNAVNDANLVKTIFSDRGRTLFNEKMNIQPYSLGYSQTTREGIETLVAQIRTQVKPNDYFVMFVASHGIINQDKYFFAPSDFKYSINADQLDRESIENGFGEDQISEYLLNIPTIFRMAILDTCHAGKEVDHIRDLLHTVTLGRRDGISVLSAAKSTQLALDGYKGHGLFSYILGEGLNGLADYNKDSIIDSMEIAQYVQDNVSRVSRTETLSRQDSVVLPDPRQSYNRRFELTQLEQKKPVSFSPNVFTPRESELYINGMQESNQQLMNGIIRNNERHKLNSPQLVEAEQLTTDHIIKTLSKYQSVDVNLLFTTGSSTLPPCRIG
jgi:uncharacterized HAD superfamily protein